MQEDKKKMACANKKSERLMTKSHPPCNKPRTKCCQSLSKQLSSHSEAQKEVHPKECPSHLIFSPHFFNSFFSACSARQKTEKNLAAAQNSWLMALRRHRRHALLATLPWKQRSQLGMDPTPSQRSLGATSP